MKVLIPLLSRQEFSKEFLEEATKKAKEVTVLLVIDTKAMPNAFGFAASEIMQGSKLLEKVCSEIKEKVKKCSEITEWGDTATKIEHVAKLNKVDAIIMQKQDNYYWNELFKQLKKNCEKQEVKAVKVEEKEEEEDEDGIFEV